MTQGITVLEDTSPSVTPGRFVLRDRRWRCCVHLVKLPHLMPLHVSHALQGNMSPTTPVKTAGQDYTAQAARSSSVPTHLGLRAPGVTLFRPSAPTLMPIMTVWNRSGRARRAATVRKGLAFLAALGDTQTKRARSVVLRALPVKLLRWRHPHVNHAIQDSTSSTMSV